MSGSSSVQVTWEDQQHILKFARLNNRKVDLDAQVTAKKRALEDLEDASNELMLSDEDVVRYAVGEVMVHIDKDDAEQRIQQQVEATEKEVAEAEEQLSTLRGTMQELKRVLYAKFGNNINLEE